MAQHPTIRWPHGSVLAAVFFVIVFGLPKFAAPTQRSTVFNALDEPLGDCTMTQSFNHPPGSGPLFISRHYRILQ